MKLVYEAVKLELLKPNRIFLEVTDEDLKFFKTGKEVNIPALRGKHTWVGQAIPVRLADDNSRGTLIWVPFVEPDEIRGSK